MGVCGNYKFLSPSGSKAKQSNLRFKTVFFSFTKLISITSIATSWHLQNPQSQPALLSRLPQARRPSRLGYTQLPWCFLFSRSRFSNYSQTRRCSADWPHQKSSMSNPEVVHRRWPPLQRTPSRLCADSTAPRVPNTTTRRTYSRRTRS